MSTDRLRRAKAILALAARSQPSFPHLLRSLFVPKSSWYDTVLGQLVRGNENRARYLAMTHPTGTWRYRTAAEPVDADFLVAVTSYVAKITAFAGVRAVFIGRMGRDVVTVADTRSPQKTLLGIHSGVQAMRDLVGLPAVKHVLCTVESDVDTAQVRNRCGLDVDRWMVAWRNAG